MPVREIAPGKYRWGTHGKVYRSRAAAQRQAAAIYSSGYREDQLRGLAIHAKASPRAESRYTLDILRIMKALHGAALAIVERELHGSSDPDLRQDAGLADARRLLARLWEQIRGWIRMHVTAAFDRMSLEVKTHTATGTKLLGIPVRSVPGLDAVISEARRANISLITNASQDFLSQVRDVLEEHANLPAAPGAGPKRLAKLRGEPVGGEGPEEPEEPRSLAEALQQRVGVSKSRALLIARDQTTKLSANLTEHRQRAAGVERWVWSTSLDERVRPTHRELHGKTFSWDPNKRAEEMADYDISDDDPSDPAPVAGTPIMCRCVALPVLDDSDEGSGPDDSSA